MADVKKIATRESYGNALVELGKENPNVVVLDADLAAATKTGVFKKEFPERHIDCGIAECNMMGMGAGLAASGMIPFVSTFAMFAAGRAYEQVRNGVGYPHPRRYLRWRRRCDSPVLRGCGFNAHNSWHDSHRAFR